jgi:hypothetical protein
MGTLLLRIQGIASTSDEVQRDGLEVVLLKRRQTSLAFTGPLVTLEHIGGVSG